VTDDKDRLLLSTLLARCLCAPLVDGPDAYALAAPGFPYRCPPGGSRGDYVAYVDSTPLVADPASLGLHANADIAKDISATEAMLANLLAMHMGGGGGSGSGSDALAAAEGAASGGANGGGCGSSGEGGGGGGGGGGARAEDRRLAGLVRECLAVLPPALFDLEATGAAFPVCYKESMNTVLVQVRRGEWWASGWVGGGTLNDAACLRRRGQRQALALVRPLLLLATAEARLPRPS
jgi:dynein heavy chain